MRTNGRHFPKCSLRYHLHSFLISPNLHVQVEEEEKEEEKEEEEEEEEEEDEEERPESCIFKQCTIICNGKFNLRTYF